MRTALFITSISALAAAIAALLFCVLLLVAIVHLNADMQNLVNAPASGSPGVLVP